jgi:nicotinamide mononucleotide transporter
VDPLELVAAGFGIASVYLSVRQIIWSWPTALVNNALYFLIFLRERLYALMGLQVFFAAIAIYGWYYWRFGGEGRTALKVSRTPPALWPALVGLALVGVAAVGSVLDRTTDDPIPYLESGLLVASLIAQGMMSRKYLENWLVWIGVNVVSIGTFLAQGLGPTAVQYLVFLGLATKGHADWRRSLTSDD